MLLHLACSAILRSRIAPEKAPFDELFGSPVLGDLVANRWLLRGKFFLPWVGAPAALKLYSWLPQVLFWGARLGGFLLIGGFAAFLLSIFWQARHT
jgi:hypothetical protein